jgi:hypothetical protein
MSVGTGRQNIIIPALEVVVSFLGIYKWEQAIYIGLSPVLHWTDIENNMVFITTNRTILHS